MIKKEVTTRQLQAEQTKEKIHDVAIRLMDEYGIDNVSIRDICREADVSTGAFYHYFQSKDDLLLITQENLDKLTTHMFDTLPAYLPVTEKIVRCFLYQSIWIQKRGAEVTTHSFTVHLRRPQLNIFSKKRPFFVRLCEIVDLHQKAGDVVDIYSSEDICSTLQYMFRGIWLDWCAYQNFNLNEKVDYHIRLVFSNFLAVKSGN